MIITFVDVIKSIINTVVRIMPISLYMGSAISAAVFSDFRGALLLFGFILNEFIALGYKMVMHGIDRPECALLMSGNQTPFVLPSPITQTVGYFVGFIFADMYANNTFSPVMFLFCCLLLMATIYSRTNIACKTLVDALYCSVLGIIIGMVYYSVIKDYYTANYLTTNGGISGVATTIDTNISNFFNNTTN